MSKDSFASGELLGFIRFVFDVTKSRNLNATQAYDDSTTQIVLTKYKATANKKVPAKSLGTGGGDLREWTGSTAGSTALTVYASPIAAKGDQLAKDNLKDGSKNAATRTVTLSYRDSEKKKSKRWCSAGFHCNLSG